MIDAAVALWSAPSRGRRVTLGVHGRAPGGFGDPAVAGTIARASGQDLSAPLSGRKCVAFRLVGQVAGNAVDDAEATSFLVACPDGTIARVLAPPATVAIDTRGPDGVPEEALDRLAGFFAARGIPRVGPAELAEGCLCEGDAVEVWGNVTDEPAADVEVGYRQSASQRFVREGPDAPLVLRRAARA